MTTIYRINTDDESKMIEVRPDGMGGNIASVVDNEMAAGEPNLANSLKESMMREVREEAKRHGLRLKDVKRMAVRLPREG
jgi:radical SAM superfamily enzyme YgiQ (UPF0313 family)